MRHHHTENGDKALWKWEGSPSLTAQTATSAAMTTQNKQEHLGVYLQEESTGPTEQEASPTLLSLAFGTLGLKKKKSLYKRHMCSSSGIVTGPPRFSF